MAEFFADSYAFVSALDGSKAYQRLLASGDFVTTRLNAVEVGYAMVLRGGKDLLATALPAILEKCVEPPPAAVAQAVAFRRERNQAGGKLSTVDAWGYATALGFGIPFLTGDEGFRGVPGVKFVKG